MASSLTCAQTPVNNLTFSCTKCGECCHNHNLPLTWDEAVSWLEDGGNVDVYCEADVWPADEARAAHRQRRSFPALCGNMNVRVTAVLAAAITGACHNLSPDLTCRIYTRRPLVCRIYPAEINPFVQLQPARKACPPEAWQSTETLLTDDLQTLIGRSRQTDQDDAPQKALLCRQLRVNVSAIHGEGFVKYSPDPNVLLTAMRGIRSSNLQPQAMPHPWRLFSLKPESVNQLFTDGAAVAFKTPGDTYIYLSA